MRICFDGFENPIELRWARPFVLEVHNRALFARVCDSLVSCYGEDACEAYSIWDGEREVRPRSAFLVVPDALNLPWESKDIGGRLYSLLQERQLEDEAIRGLFDSRFRELRGLVSQLLVQLEGDYRFGLEWDLQRFLKAFGFTVDFDQGAAFIDRLILFLDCCADMQVNKALLFVNLKTFLTEKEVARFYERVFFHELRVLMLENDADMNSYALEDKMVVDQHFLES